MNFPLETASATPHRFWIVVASFSFISRCFLTFFSDVFSGCLVAYCLLFSPQIVSNSLQPYGMQHASFPVPEFAQIMSIELVMLSNCLILYRPLLLQPSVFPSIRVFSSESHLCIRWPECWSFSISPSNEYSGLISFRIDWFDLLAVQGTQESSPAPQFKGISSQVLSLLYGPALTSLYDCWENRSFYCMDLCHIFAAYCLPSTCLHFFAVFSCS